MLAPGDLERAQAARDAPLGLPALHVRAQAADAHWGAQIEDVASFRNLYFGVHRAGSRTLHGSAGSLLPYIAEEHHKYVVGPPQADDTLPAYSLVSPILAVTLLVLDSQVMWIDEGKVRALSQ